MVSPLNKLIASRLASLKNAAESSSPVLITVNYLQESYIDKANYYHFSLYRILDILSLYLLEQGYLESNIFW